MAGELQGWRFRLEVVSGGVRVVMFVRGGEPAHWIEAARERQGRRAAPLPGGQSQLRLPRVPRGWSSGLPPRSPLPGPLRWTAGRPDESPPDSVGEPAEVGALWGCWKTRCSIGRPALPAVAPVGAGPDSYRAQAAKPAHINTEAIASFRVERRMTNLIGCDSEHAGSSQPRQPQNRSGVEALGRRLLSGPPHPGARRRRGPRRHDRERRESRQFVPGRG